jgi:prefoldin beta subunit
MVEDHECSDDCDCHNHSNPFENLDEETQAKIQELQMLDQTFQQLLMQKNAFSSENNEVDLIIDEVSKTEGEVMRIVGGQVAIKTTKEKILEDMHHKKELISTRLESIDKQEEEMNEKIESLRDEIMKKIQG